MGSRECMWAMCPFSLGPIKPHTNFCPALQDNLLAKLSQWSNIVSVHYESQSRQLMIGYLEVGKSCPSLTVLNLWDGGSLQSNLEALLKC